MSRGGPHLAPLRCGRCAAHRRRERRRVRDIVSVVAGGGLGRRLEHGGGVARHVDERLVAREEAPHRGAHALEAVVGVGQLRRHEGVRLAARDQQRRLRRARACGGRGGSANQQDKAGKGFDAPRGWRDPEAPRGAGRAWPRGRGASASRCQRLLARGGRHGATVRPEERRGAARPSQGHPQRRGGGCGAGGCGKGQRTDCWSPRRHGGCCLRPRD